jgi:large subunit ribosomal protein L25
LNIAYRDWSGINLIGTPAARTFLHMAQKAKQKQKVELKAQKRTILGRQVKQLRREGFVPAVLYGKGQEAIALQVPVKDFTKTLKVAGESTLVYLNVDADSYPTIIHDVTWDPIKDSVIHADFYKVRLDEKIKTNVPVVFVGEAPAVKDLQGIFVRNVNELEVEALPQDLPSEISIDISGMKAFGDQIQLKDVKLGDGIQLIGEPDEIIATVQEPKSQEELEAELAEPTTDVSAVEAIEKEKAEEEVPAEGEEAPAAAPEEKAE